MVRWNVRFNHWRSLSPSPYFAQWRFCVEVSWHGARAGVFGAHIHEREEQEMSWSRIAMALVFGVVSAVAVAGTKTNTTVYIGSGYASGSLSSARYSSNTLEFMSCDLYSTGYISCSARNSGGTYASCSTNTANQPAFAQLIAGMNSASFLAFWWDTATGQCTNILLRNGSNYLP
jgi:hypothetical protein